MTRVFAGPLEDRPHPSSWAGLLALALPALDHAMPDEREVLAKGGRPRWTLGGGTALALRIGHRRSDDLDVFLSGVRLAVMTPARNPHAGVISEVFQWPGSYLKFERAEGEVDFLGSALQTDPGYDLQTFRGRQICLETIDEVMVKKLRYRAANFTDRDGFDLACVLRARPEVALTIATEAGDTLPRARLALEGGDPDKIRRRIRDPGPEFKRILDDPVGEALRAIGIVERERDAPPSAEVREAIGPTVEKASLIAPGRRRGKVWIEWDGATDETDAHKDRLLRGGLTAKAAVLIEWRRRDPVAFEAWDARNRPGASDGDRKIDKSKGMDGL